MTRRLSILIALLAICASANAQLLPPTDSGWGTNSVPPEGSWQGLCGLPTDINDVIQDNIYATFCDPTVSIPGSALVCPTDGVSDCYAALQTALTNATNFSAVILPPGNFLLSHPLSINSNYVILKGAASWTGGTVLLQSNYVASGNQNPSAIVIASHTTDTLYGQLYISNSPCYGTNWFAIPLGTTGTVGTWKYAISQHSNALFGGTNLEFIFSCLTDTNSMGMSTFGWAGETELNSTHPPTNLIAQIVRIGTNFGTNGPLVYFTNDHAFCFDFTNGPAAYPLETPIVGAGVENIQIVNVFTNAKGNSGGMIEIEGGQYCFIKNVVLQDAPRDGIFCEQSYGCQFQDLYLRYALFTDSGDGYGLHLIGPCTGCIFEDAVIWGFRHSLIGEGPLTECGWAYCWCIGDNDYVDSHNWMMNDGIYHSACAWMCFMEGCFFGHGMTDSAHGTGGDNCLWIRCYWSMGISNTPGNPTCLTDTNYYVKLGDPQTGVNTNIYLFNHKAFSANMSNKWEHLYGCVLSPAGISNFPTAAYMAPAGNSVPEIELGWANSGGLNGYGGEGGTFMGDLTPSNTLTVDGCYSRVRGSNVWANGPHTLTNSCYLANGGASPPGWWNSHGGSPKYPPVTPENGVNNMLPADWQFMLPATIKWLTTESNHVVLANGVTWDKFLMNN